MKAIKFLVFFMGLLLVAGLGLLGYGLYAKTGRAAKPANVVTAANVAEFGQTSIPVAAGSKLDRVLVVGDRVVLHLTGGAGDRLVVLDPASGQVSGSFILSPEAPSK